MGRINIE